MCFSRMDLATAVTLAVLLWISALLLISSWSKMYKRNNLPPGPTPLPFIGNLLQIKSGEIVSSLMKLRKKYGDLFTIYLGLRRVIVVCGYENVRKALIDQGEDFLGRGAMPSGDKVYKQYGVAFTNNMARWKQMRRFTVMTLKDFGMGKKSTEELILDEIHCLLEELRKMKGLPFDPRELFGCVTSNIVCSIMIGKRYDFKDPELHSLMHMINDCFHGMSSFWGQLYDTYPHIMDYLPGPHNKIFKHLENLLEFVEKRVKNNQETLDPSSPRDFIDCFLLRMEQEKNNPSTEFHMTNLLAATLQIFFAGLETIGTTITYGFLMLLKYPDVREKVQEEIDRVIGRERLPNMQDRSKMPYTDAVCHEIQRFANLIPFGVPRAVVRDTVFQGYSIPKDSNVFMMLHTVLRDPQKFRDPDSFNPENFLDENGGFKSNDAFIPLSAGKRMCPAEGLTRMEIFLIIVATLQNCNIKSLVEPEKIDLFPVVSGLGNLPKPYQLCVVSRG